MPAFILVVVYTTETFGDSTYCLWNSNITPKITSELVTNIISTDTASCVSWLPSLWEA